MSDNYQAFLLRLAENLNILRERQAKYSGNAPLGQVGTLDVDVQTGELLYTPEILDEIKERGHALAERATSQAEYHCQPLNLQKTAPIPPKSTKLIVIKKLT